MLRQITWARSFKHKTLPHAPPEPTSKDDLHPPKYHCTSSTHMYPQLLIANAMHLISPKCQSLIQMQRGFEEHAQSLPEAQQVSWGWPFKAQVLLLISPFHALVNPPPEKHVYVELCYCGSGLRCWQQSVCFMLHKEESIGWVVIACRLTSVSKLQVVEVSSIWQLWTCFQIILWQWWCVSGDWWNPQTYYFAITKKISSKKTDIMKLVENVDFRAGTSR